EHQSKAPYDIRKHLATPVDAYFAKLDTGLAIRIPKIDESRWTGVVACSNLLVQPHVLITIAVVGAVHHDGNALDIGLPAGAHAAVEDDRAGRVFLKFLVDLPDQLLALGDVGLHRLLVDRKSTRLNSSHQIISYAAFYLSHHHYLPTRRSSDLHVLITIAVVGAVHHDGNALDIGLPAGAHAAVEDDRAGRVFLKFLVDLPDQLLALGDVGLHRLL